MSFHALGLRPELLRIIAEEGYVVPTPVQVQAIPHALRGRDILAGAQTGTGKTAGFALPILQRLEGTRAGGPGRTGRSGAPPARPIRALILTPTRELAAQVELAIRTYGRYLSLRSAAVFGGVGITPQKTVLRRGVDILVATPGRLLDHLSQRTADLSRVEILVLDEADRMLDMGFIRDIRKILAVLPRDRQNLLFSATFSDEIRRLADEFLRSPEVVQVSPRNAAADLVAQVVHPVDRTRKRHLLAHLIRTGDWRQVLVFTRTKHGANRLAQLLAHDGIATRAIHGNKTQGARTQALGDFKRGRVRVLVATDIAARGLDIDQLPHVVNYELPHVPEDYVHRIGRTGRAGSEGTAVSLVCVDEQGLLRDIERLLRRNLPREIIGGYEPDPAARPQPIEKGRRSRPQGATRGIRRGGAGSGKGARRSTPPRTVARPRKTAASGPPAGPRSVPEAAASGRTPRKARAFARPRRPRKGGRGGRAA